MLAWMFKTQHKRKASQGVAFIIMINNKKFLKMSELRNGDEGVGPRILVTMAAVKRGCEEPTFVSRLEISLHASMSLGMESGPWGGSILV